MNIGKIIIDSSNDQLVEGFKWAKKQALSYAHGNDPVGKWYEAALPERDAFCMRDVAHQSMGAHVLGLQEHTKNMLRKFAANISESRDWCSYWEINKDDLPAPVDYRDDADFWYNLPANFDVLNCCLRQYLWTGDKEYIEDPVFLNFYQKTVDAYVDRWDVNGDGFLGHRGGCSYRGIASYLEGQVGKKEILVASDLIAAQYAGYSSYAEILSIKDDYVDANIYKEKAEALKSTFNKSWWDDNQKAYYTAHFKNGERCIVPVESAFENREMVTPMPLYFNITEEGQKTKSAIDVILACDKTNVETRSHYPEILYNYGYHEDAYRILMDLVDPSLHRREYPEVSYAVVGSVLNGMLGIDPDVTGRCVSTKPRFTEDVQWVSAFNVPIFENEITIECRKENEMTFINTKGDSVVWKPIFLHEVKEILVDGERVLASHEIDKNGRLCSYVEITVDTDEERNVRFAD